MPTSLASTASSITKIALNLTLGTLAPHLREASEGLAEVFCLTDPSRPDNPIVFASEGMQALMTFQRTYSHPCRIPQDYSVWHELRYWPQLPLPPGSKNKSAEWEKAWTRR